MNVISVQNLVKSYGSVKALDGISFDVPEGSVYGFLGPNGAGKSTTISILLQFLHQNSGAVSIFGQDVTNKSNLIQIKKRIGFIPDADLPKIEGLRLLKHSGRYYGLQGQQLNRKIIEVVKRVNAQKFIKRNTGKLSKGQKSRIKIANALINDPDLLIADEPTSGLDPVSRSQFLETITDFVHQQNKTVFLSSHVIGEIEKVNTNLLILSEGRVVTQGTLAEITKNLPASNRYLVAVEGITQDELSNLSGVQEVTIHSPGRFAISTKNGASNSPPFLQELINNSTIRLNYFSRDNVTLENIFFDVVKGEQS